MSAERKPVPEPDAWAPGTGCPPAQCCARRNGIAMPDDHANCIACRRGNQGGLDLAFELQPDGSVAGAFPCDAFYQGYEGCLHGGVIALLLDAAMMHCLMAHGVRGVTIRLNVQFRQPVEVNTVAIIRARIVRESSVRQLRAELRQLGRLCAVAEGFFVEQAKGWPP